MNLNNIQSMKVQKVIIDFGKQSKLIWDYSLNCMLKLAEENIRKLTCIKWDEPAQKVDTFDKCKFYCESHAQERDEYDSFEDPMDRFNEFVLKMKRVDVEMVKIFCIKNFGDLECIKKQLCQKSTEKINDSFSSLEKQFGDLIDEMQYLNHKIHFNDLSNLISEWDELLKLSTKLHQLIGLAFSKFISSEILHKLCQDVIGEQKRAIPDVWYGDKFEFVSVFVGDKNVGLSEDEYKSNFSSKDTKIVSLQNEIEKLKSQLSSATDQIHSKSHHHISGVRKTVSDHTEEIMLEIERLKRLPDNKCLNEESALAIWCDQPGDRKFVEKTMEYSFPELKSLSIIHLDSLKKDEDFFNLNTFMARWFTKPLRWVQISAERWADVSYFDTGMRILLSLSKRQVFLKNLRIEGIVLKDIFESSSQASRLILHTCDIGDLCNFQLDECIDYKIEILDLFGTVNSDTDEGLNGDILAKFLFSIAKTSLKDSLKAIHITENDYMKDQCQAFMNEVGFKAVLKTGNTWPLKA
jgi:hypothetical protein